MYSYQGVCLLKKGELPGGKEFLLRGKIPLRSLSVCLEEVSVHFTEVSCGEGEMSVGRRPVLLTFSSSTALCLGGSDLIRQV